MARVVAGRRFDFTQQEIETRMSTQRPETVRLHSVRVGGRRFPPNQVVAHVTGWPRSTFRTQDAVRVLTSLGFICQRHDDPPAERMRVAFLHQLMRPEESITSRPQVDETLTPEQLLERATSLAEANHEAVYSLSGRVARMERQLEELIKSMGPPRS